MKKGLGDGLFEAGEQVFKFEGIGQLRASEVVVGHDGIGVAPVGETFDPFGDFIQFSVGIAVIIGLIAGGFGEPLLGVAAVETHVAAAGEQDVGQVEGVGADGIIEVAVGDVEGAEEGEMPALPERGEPSRRG